MGKYLASVGATVTLERDRGSGLLIQLGGDGSYSEDGRVLQFAQNFLSHVMIEPNHRDAARCSIGAGGNQDGHDRQASHVIASVDRDALPASPFHVGVPVLEFRGLLPPKLGETRS